MVAGLYRPRRGSNSTSTAPERTCPVISRQQFSPQPVVAPLPAILVVDGDPDTRALYRAIFGPLASEVHESEDGAEALGMAICHRPDVIITETHLRRIDGFALCRLLRTDPATRATKIIVVTAAVNQADSVRAIKAGADQVFAKPCDTDMLVAAAQQLCDPTRPVAQASGVDAAPAVDANGTAAATGTNPRRPRSRTFLREYTTTPPFVPPALHCPGCDAMLVYKHSHTGGVNETAAEQWDYFECAECGPYQYRHRTRKLKAT